MAACSTPLQMLWESKQVCAGSLNVLGTGQDRHMCIGWGMQAKAVVAEMLRRLTCLQQCAVLGRMMVVVLIGRLREGDRRVTETDRLVHSSLRFTMGKSDISHNIRQ